MDELTPQVRLYEIGSDGQPWLRATFDSPTANAPNVDFDLYERGERRELFMSLAWSVLITDDEPPLPVLAVAGRGRLIHILDGRSLRCHRTLSGHGRTITSVAFSDEYEHALVSTSHDRTASVWDLRAASADDECVALLSGPGGHTDGLLSAAWHPCLPLIVTTGVDCFVALWSVADTSVTAPEPAEAVRGRPIRPLKVAFPIWATRELHVDWPIQAMWIDEYTLATIARTRDDLPFDLPPELDDGEDAPLKSPVLRAGRIAEREDHELVIMCPRILLDLDSELLDVDAPPLHVVDDPGPQSTGILSHRHSAAFVELSRTVVPHQLDWSAGAALIPGVGCAHPPLRQLTPQHRGRVQRGVSPASQRDPRLAAYRALARAGQQWARRSGHSVERSRRVELRQRIVGWAVARRRGAIGRDGRLASRLKTNVHRLDLEEVYIIAAAESARSRRARRAASRASRGSRRRRCCRHWRGVRCTGRCRARPG